MAQQTQAQDHYQVRKLGADEVRSNTEILDCPLVYSGSAHDCQQHAVKQGWTWRRDRYYLFGGYWVDSEGNGYMPC